MRKLMALGFSAAVLAGTPMLAQATPEELASTVATCRDVIAEQYDSNSDPLPRWLECVNPVTTFVKNIGAASPASDPEIGTLVEDLVALYQFDDQCKIKQTELPLAIRAAADATYDPDTKALYEELYQQILDCDFAGTAALADPPASPA